MSDYNQYMVPDSNGQVSRPEAGTFPAFGISFNAEASLIQKTLGINSAAGLHNIPAATPNEPMSNSSSYQIRPIPSSFGRDAQSGVESSSGMSAEETTRLWGVKHAIESGQRSDLADAAGHLQEINRNLGLSDTHRGSSHIGKV